VVLFCLWIFFW